jgi:SAM-dependent methyltransferase
MVEVARECSKDRPNVEYLLADAASWESPRERFDCVASIATLHHLPLGPMLAKMRDALRPGRILLVLDLYRASTATYRVRGALAMPVSKAIRLARTGQLAERQTPEVRKAWEEHGETNAYPPSPRYAGPARPSCGVRSSGGASFGAIRSSGANRHLGSR